MKTKIKQGKRITYGFANPEMNKQLRTLGHKVVSDKKKQANKKACRGKEGLLCL